MAEDSVSVSPDLEVTSQLNAEKPEVAELPDPGKVKLSNPHKDHNRRC